MTWELIWPMLMGGALLTVGVFIGAAISGDRTYYYDGDGSDLADPYFDPTDESEQTR